MGHKLRTGLAVGIGVIAVEAVGLPVAVLPLHVLVNLIGGDVDKRTHRGRKAHAL